MASSVSTLLPVLSKRASPEAVDRALARYREYLESIRDGLPRSAYEFASAPWHYDYNDHRCPHDSWVESIEIRERSSGARHEKREIEIAIQLLGTYQDGYLALSYPGVSSYSLSNKDGSPKTSHGDWLVDEIRLSENNLVLHEILFSSESRWTIESRDIFILWKPTIANPSV